MKKLLVVGSIVTAIIISVILILIFSTGSRKTNTENRSNYTITQQTPLSTATISKPPPSYKKLLINKTELVEYLLKTQKNIFFNNYKDGCDSGEGTYFEVFFCSVNDDLIYFSIQSIASALVDKPLSRNEIFQTLEEITGKFNQELVTSGWVSQSLQSATENNSIEITKNDAVYSVELIVFDEYQLVIDASPGTKTTDLPNSTPTNYPKYYSLGNYDTNGRIWKAIRVKPDITEEETVTLAKEIHASDPTGEYKVFNDDDKNEFNKYRIWDKNPENEFDSWAEEKFVCSIQKILDTNSNKLEWKVVFSGYFGNFKEFKL